MQPGELVEEVLMIQPAGDVADPAREVFIELMGGNCPVQAEGTVGGKEFYFRARGCHWRLCIGGADPVGSPEWEHAEWYGQWPDAGWMTEEEAEAFLRAAAARYLAGLPGAKLEDNPERWAHKQAEMDAIRARAVAAGWILPLRAAVKTRAEPEMPG